MRWIPVVALALLPGCDILAVNCSTVLIYGVTVTVTDSATGGAIASPTYVITAQDGAYVEEREVPGAQTASAIVEDRPGTYRLSVRAQEYALWSADVRVRMADECHVRTTEVNARLQRDD